MNEQEIADQMAPAVDAAIEESWRKTDNGRVRRWMVLTVTAFAAFAVGLLWIAPRLMGY